jgi:hypothetical protein
MPTKQVGAVYLVDSKNLQPAVLHRYRNTLPSNEKKSKLVKVKVLCLVPGSRSYDCQVQGIADKVKLSSTSLGQLHASGSIQGAPIQSETSSEISHGSEAGEDEDSSAGSSAEAAPAIEDTDIAGIVASDWKQVAAFTDQIPLRYPTFDSSARGMLRVNVPKTPCDLFLAFFPIALVEPCVDSWREHAAEHDRNGLNGLDSRLLMCFLALLVRMGLMGLRRREEYFGAGSSAGMSQAVFQNLLYTVRVAGLPAYEEGQAMPDGRPAFPNDPFKPARRFADAVLQVWHDLYVPGSLLVADETMVGWTGATNIHITMLPNKPTSKGVCLKTLCDASTRVMINFEFVEGKVEQGVKRCAEEGRAAAVCLRLTEPWHNDIPRILLADAWFGGLPTPVGLMRRGFL